jgi:MFS family permease
MAAVLSSSDARTAPERAGVVGWLVFAISFGLLLSDYMSRQVLGAVFPLLKVEWGLADGQLGALAGVVALMVGLLTFPLSLLADRVGRVRSVVAMAAIWSLATLGCGLAANFHQMLAARFFVGVGEAAYGSVGLAVVFTYFPRSLRATITGAFMAGGVFGSFLGMALGGVVAGELGWRWSFAAMALTGLLLIAVYPVIVKERTDAPAEPAGGRPPLEIRTIVRAMFASRAACLAYIGSGLQLFVMGAMVAWLTSYFNRAYGLPAERAAIVGAGYLLIGGVGMIVCGALADRAGRVASRWRLVLAGAFGVATCVLLASAFTLPHGFGQLLCLALGLFFAAGAAGPAGAIVADAAPPQFHGAALATLTLANNLIGLAPGAAVTGMLADRIGLPAALALVPFAGLAAAACFWSAAWRPGSNPHLHVQWPPGRGE